MPLLSDELVRPTVHDSGDIGKAIAGTPQESLVGSVFGGVANELRYRLPLDGGRPLELLVQLRIKTKASQERPDQCDNSPSRALSRVEVPPSYAVVDRWLRPDRTCPGLRDLAILSTSPRE
jgi:hypothetical protein